MANRNELLVTLEQVLGDSPGVAVLHSSLATLMPTSSISKWDALYAIGSLVQQGWTFALPAFTFSFCRTGIYDCDKTGSETGILADWVYDGLAGSRRTNHPIYSFVVIGPLSHDIAACPSQTTFGDNSPFGLFERLDATIVMLGADWSYCTPFHRYEERAQVPYRLFKTFSGEITRTGTSTPISVNMYVRDLEIAAENDFNPLVDELRRREQIVTAPLWRANVEATRMSAIRQSAEALLENDALAFVGNAAEVRYRLEMAEEARRLPPFRIALLGNSNLDVAGNAFRVMLAQLMPGRTCDLYTPPFGQMAQQIIMPGSKLASHNPELTIFADRLEDLVGVSALDQAEADNVIGAVQQHAGIIRRFCEENGGTIVVHRFALAGRYTVERTFELAGMVQIANQLMGKKLGDLDQIVWVDIATEAAAGASVSDMRMWHLGRIPFSQSFTERLVRRWSGIVLAILGKTARLIVLDLDNTLWGGVLGEDGAEGIVIGGDFPGNAFSHFQQTLKSLSDNGVALAVSSKNDEDIAIDVLMTHKNMVIRLDDLVSHRINWQPKWQNIREIAAELNLGLGSVLFIDDNPVEREAVRRNLPMVKVLDLPKDITAYSETLLESPWIEIIRTGQEDRKRVASYKARQKINLERSAAASLEDFLRSLDMKLYIQPLDISNLSRAAQLCQKTNQFNTTTRRYSARDLEKMAESGSDIVVIGLEDKFTARENIGLIVLNSNAESSVKGYIDLFLLSCRVLGRTVEKAVLDWSICRALERDWSMLYGEIIETPRNTPVRRVFADYGFDYAEVDGLWCHPVCSKSIPDWFELHDSFHRTEQKR